MMNPGEWDDWLKQWFKAHPLKEPSAALQQQYRQEVMARIREESAPSRVLAWILRPRFTFAFGGALAAALAVLMLASHSPVRQTGQIEQEAQVLFEATGVASLNDADLEEEVQAQDRIVLEVELGSDEELLQEIQRLDNEEIALSY